VVRGLRGKPGRNQQRILHPHAKSSRREAGYSQESSLLAKFLGAIAEGRRRRSSTDPRLKPNLSGDCGKHGGKLMVQLGKSYRGRR